MQRHAVQRYFEMAQWRQTNHGNACIHCEVNKEVGITYAVK